MFFFHTNAQLCTFTFARVPCIPLSWDGSSFPAVNFFKNRESTGDVDYWANDMDIKRSLHGQCVTHVEFTHEFDSTHHAMHDANVKDSKARG